jgi:hypothetical protein
MGPVSVWSSRLIPRADFAEILDKLVFLSEKLARLPTRREVPWIALETTLGALVAVGAVALLLGR